MGSKVSSDHQTKADLGTELAVDLDSLYCEDAEESWAPPTFDAIIELKLVNLDPFVLGRISGNLLDRFKPKVSSESYDERSVPLLDS